MALLQNDHWRHKNSLTPIPLPLVLPLIILTLSWERVVLGESSASLSVLTESNHSRWTPLLPSQHFSCPLPLTTMTQCHTLCGSQPFCLLFLTSHTITRLTSLTSLLTTSPLYFVEPVICGDSTDLSLTTGLPAPSPPALNATLSLTLCLIL